MLDDDVIDFFRARADKKGLGYQILIDQTLRDALSKNNDWIDEETLRGVIREEIRLQKECYIIYS